MNYVAVEATPTELVYQVRRYYEDIFADRQADFAFPGKDIETLDDALDMVRDTEIKVFLLFAVPAMGEIVEEITGRPEGSPVASVHLTNFCGLSAHSHFSIHPEFVPYKKEIVKAGRDFLTWIFGQERRDEPGVPFLTTIIGTTPRYNIGALALARDIGYRRVDIIKKGIFSRVKNRYCDLVISKIERVDVNAWYE